MPRSTTNIRTAVIVGLSALVLNPVSFAEIIEVKWNADGKFEHTQSVASGKFVEICETLAKGSAVAWQFKASAPLNFNVHFHQGKDVVFPEKQDGVSELQRTLFAKSKEDYCWMWTNKGSVPSSLKLTLSRLKPTL